MPTDIFGPLLVERKLHGVPRYGIITVAGALEGRAVQHRLFSNRQLLLACLFAIRVKPRVSRGLGVIIGGIDNQQINTGNEDPR